MIYDVLISAVQHNDSVIHVYTFFHILFYYGLLQDIEYSSLCYIIGSCSSILYNNLHLQSQTPKLSLPLPLATTILLSVSVSLCKQFQKY